MHDYVMMCKPLRECAYLCDRLIAGGGCEYSLTARTTIV